MPASNNIPAWLPNAPQPYPAMSTTSALRNKLHTGLRDDDFAGLTKTWEEAFESVLRPLLEGLKNDINTLFATLEEGSLPPVARSQNLSGSE